MGFEVYNMTLRHILKISLLLYILTAKEGGVKQILKSLWSI